MSRALVEQAIMLLLCEGGNAKYRGKRFYGALLNQMKRIYDPTLPAPAGVSITDTINLYINPKMFGQFTEEQRIQILEHECLHIIGFHFDRFKKNCDKADAKLWNFATDLAINGPLTSLHEFGLTVDKFKDMIPDLKENESAEYYFKKLKQYQQENGGKGGKGDSDIEGAGELVDDHDKWDESNGNGESQQGDAHSSIQNSDLAKEMVKKAMKDAIEQTKGNTPMEVLQALDRLSKSSVNWKQQLKRFWARVDAFVKEPTRKKRNRRYGLLYAGRKKNPVTHIAVALDESGSVGNNEFTQFFAELDKIVEAGAKVTVIHADCTINNVYEYEKGMKIERTGMGGTAYMPAIDEAKKLKVDGMIYFGDGDIFGEKLTQPKFPFLWAMVRGNNPPAEWGGVCQVEVKGERY